MATEINLKGELQQLILEQHNLKRSHVANGKLPGFPTASKMLEMVCNLIAFMTEQSSKQFIYRLGTMNLPTLLASMLAPAL